MGHFFYLDPDFLNLILTSAATIILARIKKYFNKFQIMDILIISYVIFKRIQLKIKTQKSVFRSSSLVQIIIIPSYSSTISIIH